jgi:O-acetylhomoserine (thiol)-lyase
LADPRDPASFAKAITDKTRLVFAETLGNPGLEVLDIAAVAEVAHKAALPLMLDSTFTTPYLCRPFEHGADLVMHSATKFLGGHGIAIGGIVVDSGRFDWAASGKFPTLTEPYAGYHGIAYAEEFGPAAMIMRARTEGLRDFGACMSPANAFYILQGIETLPVRMARHVANAEAVARFLESHAAVMWVKYPGLENHPDHGLAKRLMPKGAGAILSFGINGGRKAGARLIERLRVFSHLANVGDAKSLVIHPASTTHQQMSAEDLAKAGVGEELVRLSIGLEDAQDLIDDLDQALAASQNG